MKLFVYGSLKPGGWSHHLLEDGVEENPQEVYIRGSIYEAGNFPALKLDDQGNVYGLMYELIMPATDLMRRLDQLEGYPHLFDRTEVTCYDRHGSESALVYFGKQKFLFEGPRVDDGIWKV